ncbi:STOREKEEPER protein-like [Camellia sinensis]|uniref:STOREKEEPER protein-like n=1 Tax=Camellia sinensis TaxID=4442 RepID=UPI001036AD70|nr:STOREKEEPER protein-like [Camellia sinensis]
MGAFHEFIKKLLRADVLKNQLMHKVKRLKKYQINAEKGKDPIFTKPHELKTFELSKKIWGGGANNVDDSARKSDTTKSRKHVKLVLQETSKVEVNDPIVDQKDFWSMFPCLKESLELKDYSNLSMPELGKNSMKDSMSMIRTAKAMELEEKWKNLCKDGS